MEKLREMIRTRQEARKMRKQNIKMKEEKSPEVEMTTPPLSSLGKRLRNNSSLKMLSAKPAKQSKISISSTPQTARVQKVSFIKIQLLKVKQVFKTFRLIIFCQISICQI